MVGTPRAHSTQYRTTSCRNCANLPLQTPMTDLDRFDRELLNLVQEDCAQTAESLAAKVPLSPSAIQRRLRRLRDEGVIAREVAVVDAAKVGRPTFFVASLQLEQDRPEHLHRLGSWLQAQPAVQQAFYVTGQADFVLVLTAPDTAAYEAFMSKMMIEHPNIKRYTTSVALNVVKRGLAVPVPGSEA